MKLNWAVVGLLVLFIGILHVNKIVIPHSILLRHIVLITFAVYAVYELYKKPKK